MPQVIILPRIYILNSRFTIFAAMLRQFLNRPLAESFDARTQLRLALQSGLYVFMLVGLLNGAFWSLDKLGVVALLALGCVGVAILADIIIPRLLPTIYDEDRWTVGRHIAHTLFVLLLISSSNQLILVLLDIGRPSFGQMYLLVTAIGFFPIMLGVFVAEQRRLKRNLAQAQVLNGQLHQRTPTTGLPAAPAVAPSASLPNALMLSSETGKERLSLQPNQLLYVESVGNYVDVYWRNGLQVEKTVLRSTLKELAETVAAYPQFLRCHRAFLINLNAVVQTEGNARGYQLTLTGVAAKIPVSRSYLTAFDEQLSRLS